MTLAVTSEPPKIVRVVVRLISFIDASRAPHRRAVDVSPQRWPPTSWSRKFEEVSRW
jgi:hypothetical protein